MGKYLLDINIILRFSNPSDLQHILAVNPNSSVTNRRYKPLYGD